MNKGDVIYISLGRCRVTKGVRVYCFACGREAQDWPWEGPVPFAHGIVDVQTPDKHRQEILCRQCHENPGINDILIRKLTGLSLKIDEGGEKSPEEVAEISDALKQSDKSTSH
jgi:hypothetical protein